MSEDYELIDNKEKKRYEFHVGEYTPVLEYIKTKNDDIYLTHTEVPIELEGKGIGSSLVKKVLEDIKSQNLRLVPLCPFVATYIKRHPEWREIILRF